MKTLEDVLREGSNYLEQCGIAEAGLDAWFLFAHCFRVDKASYFLKTKEIVDTQQYDEYQKMIKKRALHVPLQHILGSQEFMGLDFIVNEHVLIPRQDTEILVETVLNTANRGHVLDMCTGSGCIIISLKKLGHYDKAVGVDISKEAINIAKQNSDHNQVEIEWIQSDLFSNVTGEFDFIVSNPPYIKTQEIMELMPEVKDHEPRIALDGHEDGLYFYRRIIEGARKYLKDNGRIFFEIGCTQAEELHELLENAGFNNIVVVKDLAGLDRVVTAKYNR